MTNRHPAPGERIDKALPPDCPALVSLTRHQKPNGMSQPPDLLGWTVHVLPVENIHGDCKIELKFVRGGPIAIIVDGAEVHRIVPS